MMGGAICRVMRSEVRTRSGLRRRTEDTALGETGGWALLSLSSGEDGYMMHLDGASLPVGARRMSVMGVRPRGQGHFSRPVSLTCDKYTCWHLPSQQELTHMYTHTLACPHPAHSHPQDQWGPTAPTPLQPASPMFSGHTHSRGDVSYPDLGL